MSFIKNRPSSVSLSVRRLDVQSIDEMAKIVNTLFYTESRYIVNRRKIRKTIEEVISEQQIEGPVEVSVAIVGDRKMRALNKKYKNQDKTTDVLAFSVMEGPASSLPNDGILRLGDVVISYPQVIVYAAQKEVMVDEQINFLVKHGLLHLLGIHHEE